MLLTFLNFSTILLLRRFYTLLDLRTNCEIKDRRYRWKTYTSVMLGCDAVAYLVRSQNITVEEAILLGNALIQKKYFHHVADDHLLENSKLFYRFYQDETKSNKKNR